MARLSEACLRGNPRPAAASAELEPMNLRLENLVIKASFSVGYGSFKVLFTASHWSTLTYKVVQTQVDYEYWRFDKNKQLFSLFFHLILSIGPKKHDRNQQNHCLYFGSWLKKSFD